MGECMLTNVCRACLTEEGEFQSVFVPDENCGLTIHLAEMIMASASVQITLGDGLPEQICLPCAKKAVQLYLFKRRCEESDTLLRERLGKSPLCLDEDTPLPDTLEIKPDSVDITIKPEICLEPEDLQNGKVDILSSNYNNSSLERSDCESDFEMESAACESKIKFQCDVCEKIYDRKSQLNRHKKSHEIKELTCETCNKKFTQQELFIRHKLTHIIKIEDTNTQEESFETVMLDEIMQSEQIQIKIEDDDLKCIQCNVIFTKREDMVTHVEKHERNEKRFEGLIKCNICQKKFSKPAHLTRHMKIHVAVRPYICELCNKSFARADQLNNHVNAHSGVKPHVCKICSKGFNQISNLKDHMRTHNGEKPFLCSTCGKGFNQLGNLRQHTIRHSGIKAHLCSICGNGFASKGELCAHLRKHTGARPFVCPTCNHGFTTSSSLTKHKRIHSGEKPYECEVCKMRFSRSGILARHKRTHTGEKPYVCKFCSKAFSQSNDLSSHLRIHTGEKPFICDSCGQAFRQSSALKTHKKTHIDRSTIFDNNRSVISHMHSTFLNTLQ